MSQGASLYYRCTLMFITGRRCIGETWVNFQYEEQYEASQGPSRPRSMAYYDTIAIFSSIYFVCFIN